MVAAELGSEGACPSATALLSTVLRAVSYIKPCHRVGRERVWWGTWLLCSAYIFLLSLLLLPASDGPDSGNCQQFSFFSVELVEQRHSSQGCVDVCGEAGSCATWGWLLRSEVSLPAALPAPFLGRKGVM